jgi:hypothetical protein
VKASPLRPVDDTDVIKRKKTGFYSSLEFLDGVNAHRVLRRSGTI